MRQHLNQLSLSLRNGLSALQQQRRIDHAKGRSGHRDSGKLIVLVSVIIPTLDRPKLLLRAIGSVLRQTHRELEVIVVVDRPDPETAFAVQSVEDARVRLVLNPHLAAVLPTSKTRRGARLV
jgi:cellulose synthase/poly-beta-1,6-N-acetylglucosamine synthase-like glycosyltransferase